MWTTQPCQPFSGSVGETLGPEVAGLAEDASVAEGEGAGGEDFVEVGGPVPDETPMPCQLPSGWVRCQCRHHHGRLHRRCDCQLGRIPTPRMPHHGITLTGSSASRSGIPLRHNFALSPGGLRPAACHWACGQAQRCARATVRRASRQAIRAARTRGEGTCSPLRLARSWSTNQAGPAAHSTA